jgi:hypothetical protein
MRLLSSWRNRSLRGCAALAGAVATLAVAGSAVDAFGTRLLDVAIVAGPEEGSTTTETTATFEFTVNEAATTTCSLDGNRPTGCTSPVTYSGLAGGLHRFVVEARNSDTGGSYSDSDRRTWTVVEIPPDEAPSPPPPEPPPPGGDDHDADGVVADIDACLATPRRARVLLRGCSAVDLVLDPSVLAEPVEEAVAQARAELETLDALADETRGVDADLARSLEQLSTMVRQLGAGRLCLAARTARASERTLSDATSETVEAVAALREEMLEQPSPGPGGDADTRDVFWHGLGYRLSLVEAATRLGGQVAAALTRACDAVVGPRVFRGRLADLDDAAGLIRLGARVGALAQQPSGDPVGEGELVRVDGTLLADGTMIVKALRPGPPDPDGPPEVVDLDLGNLLPCLGLALRIAPVQRFAPPIFDTKASDIVLHHPGGYLFNGKLRLEALMRLGAVELGDCPDEAPTGEELVYGMQIVMSYTKTNGKPGSATLAEDLRAGGHPVPLQLPIDYGKDVTITATSHVRACTEEISPVIVEDPIVKCSTPTPLLTETYVAAVLPQGFFYAAAKYKSLILTGIEDGDPTSFAGASVTGFSYLSTDLAGTNPFFEAEGYLLAGGASSKPAVKPITADDSFAVYYFDFWSPSSQYLAVGVDHAAGLRWPRVKGTRNGKPYWYLAQLPEIVKDALNYCGPGLGAAEWSYYRLPWPPGYPRVVGQANFSKPTHDGSQAYAFDFKLFNGGAIRAARGGTVIGLIEGYVMNVDPSVTEDDPSKWIPGNWLLIQHEDGTRSFYTHMQTNGVLVDVGDTVKRGDYIAIVGNTGNSSGPHLHFHVLDAGLGKDEGAAHGDPTIPIRFQTGPALLPHLSNKTCYLPQKGDVLTSNHPS